MMDPVQRAILENQVILAEALWMLVRNQGGGGSLEHVSARIAATRKMLEGDNGGNMPNPAMKKQIDDI
jgi:hypothetical protein